MVSMFTGVGSGVITEEVGVVNDNWPFRNGLLLNTPLLSKVIWSVNGFFIWLFVCDDGNDVDDGGEFREERNGLFGNASV